MRNPRNQRSPRRRRGHGSPVVHSPPRGRRGRRRHSPRAAAIIVSHRPRHHAASVPIVHTKPPLLLMDTVTAHLRQNNLSHAKACRILDEYIPYNDLTLLRTDLFFGNNIRVLTADMARIWLLPFTCAVVFGEWMRDWMDHDFAELNEGDNPIKQDVVDSFVFEEWVDNGNCMLGRLLGRPGLAEHRSRSIKICPDEDNRMTGLSHSGHTTLPVYVFIDRNSQLPMKHDAVINTMPDIQTPIEHLITVVKSRLPYNDSKLVHRIFDTGSNAFPLTVTSVLAYHLPLRCACVTRDWWDDVIFNQPNDRDWLQNIVQDLTLLAVVSDGAGGLYIEATLGSGEQESNERLCPIGEFLRLEPPHRSMAWFFVYVFK